jgi:hypothetical protein
MLQMANIEIFATCAQRKSSPDKVPTPPRRVLKEASCKGMQRPFCHNQVSLLLLSPQHYQNSCQWLTPQICAFSSSNVTRPQVRDSLQVPKNVASDKTEGFARRAQRKISPNSEPTTLLQLQFIVDGRTMPRHFRHKLFFLRQTASPLA